MISLHYSFLYPVMEEEPLFSVLSQQGPFEIRMYPRLVSAKVLIKGDFTEAIPQGIQRLQNYLEGNNFSVTPLKGHRGFYHVHNPEFWEVGILFPAQLFSELPLPIDRGIQLEEIASRRVGALRYKGEFSPEIVERRAEELKKWLRRKGLAHDEFFRVCHQKHFMSIPFLKDSEVQLDIR